MPEAQTPTPAPASPSLPTPVDRELLAAQLPTPIDWPAIFGRQAPLVVELGCGSGRFIIGQAEAHPELDFVAVERAGEYFQLLKERVGKRPLPNMRVLKTDATTLVARFPAACVQTYHIYFPDPWPKKRHHKRRLIQPAFCAQLKRTLAHDGRLFFATDHAAYCTEAVPRLEAEFAVTHHPGPWEDAPLGRTNYEIKYMKVDRPIWRYSALQKST